jgi:putative transposase
MNALVPWSPPVNIMPEAAMEFGGKLYIYRGRARDNQHRHVFVADDGLSRDFADMEIVRLLEKPAAGSKPPMRWVTAAEMANISAGKASNWSSLYADADPLEKLRVDTLLVYIRAWEHAGGPSKTEEALSRLIADTVDIRGVARISASSLRRALRRYDGDIDSLVTRDDLKGNSNPKADQKVREMHHAFACDAYFVPERPSLAAVHQVVLEKFREWNESVAANGCPLTPLSLSTTRTMIEEEGRFIHDYTRMGRRQAKARHRAVTKAPEASSANEAWEVDASLLPVIALDDDSLLPIGRPTATFLLDRFSRAIPGFDFAWRAESFHSVAEAVRMGVSTKDALMAASGIAGVYPMCGLPGMLVADQARHTRATGGAAFKLMCDRIGCEPSNTPVLKPWFKGKIERLLRTYFFKMCHVVPGSTYSDIFARSKETPPEKVAVCTFSEMKAHVLRFIVEIYHPKYHRGIESSPLAAYKASASRFGITPPPDYARLTAILSVPYSRTIQATGLEINGLHYSSTALMDYKQVNGRANSVDATVDRQDISQAWWIDPRDGKELRLCLPEVDRPRYRGVTIEKYERVRALQRNNPEMLAGDAGAERAYALYLSQILELSGSKGLTNRRRAMRAWEKLRSDAHAKFNDDVEEIPVTEGGLLDEVLDFAEPARPATEPKSLPQPGHPAGSPQQAEKKPRKDKPAKASTRAPAPDDASTMATKAAAAVSGSAQPLPPPDPDPQDDQDDLADIRAQAAQLLERSRQGRREDNE